MLSIFSCTCCPSVCLFWENVYSDLPVLLFFFFFLGPQLWHMEFPRLGGQIGTAAAGLATATATWDLSHVCDLHHSSWQHRILNPLSETRDWTCILMDPSQVCYCWVTTGAPSAHFKTRFWSFCCCVFWVLYIFWILIPYILFANIFSHSVGSFSFC